VEFHGTTSDLKRELVELSHVFNTLKETECRVPRLTFCHDDDHWCLCKMSNKIRMRNLQKENELGNMYISSAVWYKVIYIRTNKIRMWNLQKESELGNMYISPAVWYNVTTYDIRLEYGIYRKKTN
jgi:hypothetical protein